MFMLTDIHTHDLVHLNVYLLTISPLNILVNITDHLFYRIVLDEMVPSPVLTFLCFKAALHLYIRFFVLTCFK